MISKGLVARLRQTAVLLVAVGGSWMAPVAHSAVTDQILDQVEVASASKLLRLKENPTTLVGLAAVRQTQFRACQSSNVNGLFCLDGQVVRSWPTVTEHELATTPTPESGIALFSCQDAALNLSSSACSAMTADVNGDIWIAGRKTDATYSIFRVTGKVGGTCPADYFAFQGVTTSAVVLDDLSENYCYSEVRSGRPLIQDLSPVEGELVTEFFSDKGILGVENFSKMVFYPRDKNKPLVEWSDWGGVQITSASILQRQVSPNTYTYGLVTTTTGLVVSRQLGTARPTVTFAAINADGGPLDRGTACFIGNNPNTFRVRGSEISGRLFATNRNYCRLFVLEPVYNGDQDLAGINVSGSANLLTGTQGGTTYPPDNLSVSPGNSINVARCSTLDGCILIGDSDGDGNGYPAVKMYGVTVEGSATGLFVFKIEDIPDCRYIKSVFPSDHPCNQPGTIVPNSGSTKPQEQYLNVTPLLPPNVTDLFDNSGKKPFGLPPLYISPRYRAQASEGYKFQALFGVADPNIQFRKTFTVEFDIGDFNLAGANLGCGVQQTDNATPPNPTPLRFNKWDIVTVVSERFSSVGGPTGRVVDDSNGDAEHVDTMINKGCYNPTPSAGTRWSMYSYNLELAEDKKKQNGSFEYSPAIAYLSNLVLSLHTDLGAAQQKLACANVDAVGNAPLVPGAAPPLTSATCASLYTQWSNAQDKLKKCAAAAQNPKNSAPNQNCNAFVTQFNTYKAMVEALSPDGIDPANRVGELWSRTDVIKYVYSHFVKAAQIGPTAANAQ